MTFKKVLIANRGEIACRVIRTLKKLNITAVAVYSSVEANAQHVLQADEAYCIGEAAATKSYLCGDKIIEVAKACGAEAIHPGYGFLAENAGFAKACAAAGIVFIGPPVPAIEAMGSKAEAKALMIENQVPTLPGYQGEDQSEKSLLQAAKKIGFPLLIKASYGGGGRGMRVVQNEKAFSEELASAKREATASFGNDHVILEKYLVNPRHVEVQIFSDTQQNYVYLFERDCSIQRRHQKVVEEAPAPGISEALRHQLGEAAVQAAKTIKYVGAGTVEFLLGEDQQFYFMEMNTRLQVEHPVTEMIVGEDLVAWQIQVAQGLPLPKTQQQLKIHGAAIEVRLCAEDPQNNFLPAIGKISIFDYPKNLENFRVDTGFVAGDQVSIYYDSLLAKMIAWGPDRETARKTLVNALNATEVLEVKTNRALLNNILQQEDFIQARLSTGFIAKHEAALLATHQEIPIAILLLAALYQVEKLQQQAQHQVDPWQHLFAWKNDNLSFQYQIAQQTYQVTLRKQASHWQADIEGRQSIAHLLTQQDHHYKIEVDQAVLEGMIWQHQDLLVVHYQQQTYQLTCLPRFGHQATDAASENQLIAPMPGRIIAQHVQQGDTVKAGQTLLIMEAMKMEHAIRAPYDGHVETLYAKIGDIVAENAQLVELSKIS